MNDRQKKENPRKVEERMLDIWGMIEKDTGVIHSKMILTDRQAKTYFYFFEI